MFLAQKMRHIFRQTREKGFFDAFMNIISWPLCILRDYSTPIGETAAWDRKRASIIPATIVFSFLWLNGSMKNDVTGDSEFKNTSFVVGLLCFIPGAFIGAMITLRTKVSEPPSTLMTVSAFFCFIMAIWWIQYTANTILDLLQLFGFITSLPEALLALTVIAWGNSLGDTSADVAMTKRGFGEMAITGCIAAPIFNVNLGLGGAMLIEISKMEDPFGSETGVTFSLYDP